MPLFTDGFINTGEDLRAYESSILDVASTEGIEFDKKLDLAEREIGVQITAFLLRQEGTGARKLDNVIVTEPLAQWHALHTLELIFRDAYNSQLNDRYQGKWIKYGALAEDAGRRFFDIGVGISTDPIAKAALPECGAVNGGQLPTTTYFVRVAWQSRFGRLGSLSEAVTVTTNAGQLLSVKAGSNPAGAVGWTLFVGTSGTDLRRQNSSALSAGSTWIIPVSGLVAGAAPAGDPAPDFYITRRRDFRG
jgi:hypothetical protein